MAQRIILGVDPGFTATGFALLRVEQNRVCLIDKGFLPLPTSLALEHRLSLFYDFFQNKITVYGVTEIAIETPFLGKNAQNFLKLGYLRGLLLLLASKNSARVREFTPRTIKLSITGSGSASKEQVMRVIMVMFPRLIDIKRLDVTDAIAIALCCLWSK
jgi:crossover junction endodeoxyribonuclease RuvC